MNRHLLLSLGALLSTGLAWPADKPGSVDHPLVSRYQGSEITGYVTSSYDSYLLTTKPSTKITDPKTPARGMALEGAYTGIVYAAPPSRSSLEVFANYQTALQRAGFQILWSCKTDCGTLFSQNQTTGTKAPVTVDTFYNAQDTRYLAAKLTRPSGDVFVAVVTAFAVKRTNILVEILETKSMDTGKVQVDAGALLDGLRRDGKVALYAVFFDLDKAILKPESKPQMEEIAKLLKNTPDLNVFVVGHTDGTGTLAYNQDLSKRRADAMVAALIKDYGIPAARLSPAGVGPLAPLASNRDEAGRARNRRVEIVEMVR